MTIDLDKRADSILSTPMAERAVMVAEDPSVLDVVKQALDAKDAKLRVAVEVANDLMSNMGGHDHWDSEMTHGANCPICIQQREARERARIALATLSAPTGDKVK